METKDEYVSPRTPLEGIDEPKHHPSPSPRGKSSGGVSRRSLLFGIGGVVALSALGGLRYLAVNPLVRPPGGQDYDQLIAGCIKCGKCGETCPHHVIDLARLEDGIIGMRTPVLNFEESFCDWCQDANAGTPLCVEVCPTGALTLPSGATAENTLLGIAELDTTTCLAYRDIGCRFCFDACPYAAMELDDFNRPYVLNDVCNGCGACEAVCVSLENGSIMSISERAIVVRALDGADSQVRANSIGGENHEVE